MCVMDVYIGEGQVHATSLSNLPSTPSCPPCFAPCHPLPALTTTSRHAKVGLSRSAHAGTGSSSVLGSSSVTGEGVGVAGSGAGSTVGAAGESSATGEGVGVAGSGAQMPQLVWQLAVVQVAMNASPALSKEQGLAMVEKKNPHAAPESGSVAQVGGGEAVVAGASPERQRLQEAAHCICMNTVRKLGREGEGSQGEGGQGKGEREVGRSLAAHSILDECPPYARVRQLQALTPAWCMRPRPAAGRTRTWRWHPGPAGKGQVGGAEMVVVTDRRQVAVCVCWRGLAVVCVRRRHGLAVCIQPLLLTWSQGSRGASGAVWLRRRRAEPPAGMHSGQRDLRGRSVQAVSRGAGC